MNERISDERLAKSWRNNYGACLEREAVLLRELQRARRELEQLRASLHAKIFRICDMQDELAQIVSTHRDDWTWADLIEDTKQLRASHAELVMRSRELVHEVVGWMGFRTSAIAALVGHANFNIMQGKLEALSAALANAKQFEKEGCGRVDG